MSGAINKEIGQKIHFRMDTSGASHVMMIPLGPGMSLFVLIVRKLKKKREVEAVKKFVEEELKIARDIQVE